MTKTKKPRTINLFGQKVPVDEYGIIDWSKVEIPRLDLPKDARIEDIVQDITPHKDKKQP